MDPIRGKLLRTFRKQGTTSVVIPCRIDERIVIEMISASQDDAGDVTIAWGSAAAAVSLDPTGNNNKLTFTARELGTAGAHINVEIIEGGNNETLRIVTTKTLADGIESEVDIDIYVATDGSGNGTSTANEVIRAIKDDRKASKYIIATNFAANDGTGVIDSDVGEAALSGGTDGGTGEFDLEAAAAGVSLPYFPPGLLMGDPGVGCIVTAESATQIFVAGFYHPGGSGV